MTLDAIGVSFDIIERYKLLTALPGKCSFVYRNVHYTLDQSSIEILSSHEESQILVKVHDTGVGIAPDQIEHIFDRFWRADRSRSHGAGFGLGLAIAQNIAQKHGGSITLTSQLGAGSCLTVRLPVDADQG